ncbi:unnamed protein product [Eretmochelys imbricata]
MAGGFHHRLTQCKLRTQLGGDRQRRGKLSNFKNPEDERDFPSCPRSPRSRSPASRSAGTALLNVHQKAGNLEGSASPDGLGPRAIDKERGPVGKSRAAAICFGCPITRAPCGDPTWLVSIESERGRLLKCELWGVKALGRLKQRTMRDRVQLAFACT